MGAGYISSPLKWEYEEMNIFILKTMWTRPGLLGTGQNINRVLGGPDGEGARTFSPTMKNEGEKTFLARKKRRVRSVLTEKSRTRIFFIEKKTFLEKIFAGPTLLSKNNLRGRKLLP